jgi:serine/threonine protein kinase
VSLDNYSLQRLLAASDYAIVHQAVDHQHNECVALKFIDKECEGDPTDLQDVLAEIDIFRSLNH